MITMASNNKQSTQKGKVVKLNPLFYPPEVIYSASYVLLEKAYFTFDGDPNKEVEVTIVPKEGFNVEDISDEFNDELVTYLEYKNNYERNKDIRHVILKKALESIPFQQTTSSSSNDDSLKGKEMEEIDEEDLFDSADDDLSYLDEDPMDIAVPWEEKYAKDKEQEVDVSEEKDTCDCTDSGNDAGSECESGEESKCTDLQKEKKEEKK